MKKLLLFVITLLCVNYLISQSCLQEGIHFKTQQSIDSFQINYPNCSKIEGSVLIDDSISGNIKNLNGLFGLTKFENSLTISHNDSLYNLIGLENIDSIGYHLSIRKNNSLLSLSAFESLKYVARGVYIEENPSIVTLDGLDKLDSIIYFRVIENESLQNLNDLTDLKKIIMYLEIEKNQSLSSLTGLDNITFVGEDLKIFDNDLLTDLQGLNNLEFIQGYLKVRYNGQLSSLNGLENLDTIKGGLSINDNPALSSLESITGSFIDYHISIYENPMLEICNINSICEFISIDPENTDIYDNASGCNSVDEVEELCLVTLQENTDQDLLRFYPNPVTNELVISFLDPIQLEDICIYNILSQKIISEFDVNNRIDVSNLEQGIYIIEGISKGKKYRNKFIKR